MELSPVLTERLIFGFGSRRRRTQDSPVLPDVWTYCATPSSDPKKGDPFASRLDSSAASTEPGLELLLTPHRDAGPAQLSLEVRQRLAKFRAGQEPGRRPARIAYTQSYVAARLYFDEVVCVLLPLTPWWRTFVWRGMFTDEDENPGADRTLGELVDKRRRSQLAAALEYWSRAETPDRRLSRQVPESDFPIADDLLWMLRIIGTIEWARRLTPEQAKKKKVEVDKDGRIASLPLDRKGEVDYALIVDCGCSLLENDLPVAQARRPSLWLINRNRPAESAVVDSRRAIKADAAFRLFDISCSGLTWAVVDSGIDATHPAFFKAEKTLPESADWRQRTRIRKTYDFTRLRPLLDQETLRELLESPHILAQRFQRNERDSEGVKLDRQLAPLRFLIDREDAADRAREEKAKPPDDPSRRRLRGQLEDLAARLLKGREIDWELLDMLLEVPHDDNYDVPINSHGTHVAGILAANWEKEKLIGVCPDIRLYDLRVLDPDGPNDEFTVLAALQFIQYLNLQKDLLSIHGANLSLSIRHQVSNYACGRTPVCEECERLVSAGVVVVAAAGNAGWDDDLARVAAGAGYRTVSITDPGNAEAVITVGATHRDRPHTYGVSFFSSRGPTGDGRAKPDLVAPGEKITSTIPGPRSKREDGTSMAAPHVSGAAALLMARHHELVGRPQRIKEILCRTATDLGRERQFQGAGMLDVLRALQSV
jgi:serine protease AprX